MDHIKRRILESLNASEEPAVLGQGNDDSRIIADPKDKGFVIVSKGNVTTRVAAAQIQPDMEASAGLSGPARAQAMTNLVKKYNQPTQGQGQGSGAGLTAPKPLSAPSGPSPSGLGEAAKRKADLQNELHGLFEGSSKSKEHGTVQVSLVHEDLVFIECSRQKLYDKLVTEAVVETPNPVNFSFYVARSNASVIAEAIKKQGARIKNTIRKISDRKADTAVRI